MQPNYQCCTRKSGWDAACLKILFDNPYKMNCRLLFKKNYFLLRLFHIILLLFSLHHSFYSTSFAREKLKISSDALTLFYEESKAEFYGNIDAKFENFQLYSDKMIIHYLDNINLPKESNTNDKIENTILEPQKILLYGHVKILINNAKISSESAEYNVSTGLITLYDNVHLTSKNSVIRGNKLIYNTKTKEVSITSDNQNSKKPRVSLEINSFTK